MPSASQHEFAQRINAERVARKLSIRAVAKIAGVPAATAQGWLSGEHFPVAALRPQYLKVVDELELRNQIPIDLWGDWGVIEPVLRELRSPYLGLRPFGVADEALFHGRSAESARLARAILTLKQDCGHGVVALVGPSGTGKSSLLAAGLAGHECGIGLTAGWQVQIATPGNEAELRVDGQSLVIFDQFEDVLLGDGDHRKEVLELVQNLADAQIVVIGLRADAFGLAVSEPILAEALTRPVLLAPLTRAEIREMIVGPAKLCHVDVDEDLMRALELDLAAGPSDVTVTPEVLPLLSNALLVTWAAGSGKRMTLADYQAAGGVSAAVESLAEEVYSSLTDDQRLVAESLFLRLVRIAGEHVLREPVPLNSVDADARLVLDAFVAARMLTLSDGKVQISHDALIAHWSRLGQWVEHSREDLEVLASIRRATQVWVDSERDDGALIPVGRLAFFSRWLTDSANQRLLNSTEREFLAVSEAHFASVLSAERQTSARLRRRGRVAISFAAAATALAVVASMFFVQAQTARAEAQSRQIATSSLSVRAKDRNVSTQMAAVSRSLAQTQEADSALVDATGADAPLRWAGEPSGVMTSSAEAAMVARGGGTGKVTLWRDDSLTSNAGTDVEVDPSKSALWAVALKKVGSRVLLAVGGKSVRSMWDVTDQPREIADLRGDNNTTTYGAAFSGDGTKLLFGTQTGEITVWDLTNPDSPQQQTSLHLDAATDASGKSATPAVSALTIGGNGVVYAGGEAGWITRWQLGSAGIVRLANLSSRYVPTGGTELASVRTLALAVSPDGKRLAAGQAGRALLTWTLGATDTEPTVLRSFSSYVNAVSYSSDSSRLIAASSDQDVSIYDTNGTELRRLANPAIMTGVGLSSGRPVAVGADGALRVWSAQNPVLRSSGGPASYNLATDGVSAGWLAAGNNYSPTDLWQLRDGGAVQMPDPQVTLPSGDTQVGAVAVAPAGNFLVGGSNQGRVILWPLSASGAGTATVVETGLGYIATVDVSPDGTLIAAMEDEGTRVALLKADGKGGASLVGVISSATPCSVAFNSDASVLALGLNDRVELWSLADPAHPALLSTLQQSAIDGTKVAASSTGSLLAIGDGSGVVALWNIADPAKPAKVREFGDAGGEIYSVDFSPNGEQLVATSGDDLIWSWDVKGQSDQAAFVLDGEFGRPWDARFVNGGNQIAVTSGKGEIKLWTATPQAAKAQLCANRGDVLTTDEWQRYLPGVRQIDPC
jgi:WD40 repeat protein